MGDFYTRKDTGSNYQPLSAVFAPLRPSFGLSALPTGLFSTVGAVSADLNTLYDPAQVVTDVVTFKTGLKSKAYTNNVDFTSNPDLQLVFRGLGVTPTPTQTINLTPTPSVTPTSTVTPTVTPTSTPTSSTGAPPPTTPTMTATHTAGGAFAGSISISVYGAGQTRGAGSIPISVSANYAGIIAHIAVEEHSGASPGALGVWQPVTDQYPNANSSSFSTTHNVSQYGYWQYRATAYAVNGAVLGVAVSGEVHVIPNDISISLTAVNSVGNTISLTSTANSSYTLIEHVIQRYDPNSSTWVTLTTGSGTTIIASSVETPPGSWNYRSYATASSLKEGGMYAYANASASLGTSVTLTVTSVPAAGGSTTYTGVVSNNSTHTITAVPNQDYEFIQFTIDGTTVLSGPAAGSSITISMNNQSHTVAALYSKKPVSFALNVSYQSGAINATGNHIFADQPSPVPIGTVINLSNTAAPGYHFVGYSVGGSPISSSYQVNSNVTITGIFYLNLGQLVSSACINYGQAPYTRQIIYADGNGGNTYISGTDPAGCGAPAHGTLLGTTCVGVDQHGTYADGNGGTYDALIEANSLACGYVPPPVYPPVGTVLGFVCINGFPYNLLADGAGGHTTAPNPITLDAQLSNAYCPQPVGTVLFFYCLGYDLYNAVANGTGGFTSVLIDANNIQTCHYVPAPVDGADPLPPGGGSGQVLPQ